MSLYSVPSCRQPVGVLLYKFACSPISQIQRVDLPVLASQGQPLSAALSPPVHQEPPLGREGVSALDRRPTSKSRCESVTKTSHKDAIGHSPALIDREEYLC